MQYLRYISCYHTLFFLTTGLGLIVRDTKTNPEELYFELRKPPQHGALLKYTAESQGPMAAGSCSFVIVCLSGYFSTISVFWRSIKGL